LIKATFTFCARSLIACVLLLSGVPLAAAGEPSAIIEDVNAQRSDVMLMDMLEPGKVILLDANEKLVLSYLMSCRQETITGGKVTVGTDKSTISEGSVVVKVVPCESDMVTASGNEAGAIVFRAPRNDRPLPKPDKTIFSLYPIIKTDPATKNAILVRLDRDEREIRIRFVNGIADLRKTNTKLNRRALYRVTSGNREAVFLIHAKAKSSERSVLSRFVVF